MRRSLERVAKQAKKMKAGQACLLRNLVQVERQVIAFVDEPARAAQPIVNIQAIRFNSSSVFHGRHFSERNSTASLPKAEELIHLKIFDDFRIEL